MRGREDEKRVPDLERGAAMSLYNPDSIFETILSRSRGVEPASYTSAPDERDPETCRECRSELDEDEWLHRRTCALPPERCFGCAACCPDRFYCYNCAERASTGCNATCEAQSARDAGIEKETA